MTLLDPQKPLFIPLKTEYFDAFASGDKNTEYRPYGKRWNDRTCVVGRPVVLSRGYGKAKRLSGVVKQLNRVRASTLNFYARIAFEDIYGPTVTDVAAIVIEVMR